MSFLHNHSHESASTALDLWALPGSQSAALEGNYVSYSPVSAVEEATMVEFNVTPAAGEYLDLAHTLLYAKVQVTDAAGAALKADVEVAPVNNLLHSMWSQCDVLLNNKLVSQSGHAYNYRAYITNLLNYSAPAKDSHLGASLWFEDTAGHFNTFGKDNRGFGKRRDAFRESRTVELLGGIHADLFNSDKFLPNGVQLQLKLYRAKDAFVLMSKGDEKLKLLECRLLVRKVKIAPEVLIAHAKALDVSPAKLPITRTDLKSFTLASGVANKTVELCSGPVPKRIILGLVSNKSFNGDSASNPFLFSHENLNFLAVYIDSQQVPSQPLTPDFANGLFLESYYTLFNGTGIHYSDNGNAVSRNDYDKGYTLWAFDFTPCLNASQEGWDLQRQATIRIDLRFAKALAESVNLVVLSEFDSLIQIDKNRNIIVDFTT